MVFLYKLVFVFILSGVPDETGMFNVLRPNASMKHELSLFCSSTSCVVCVLEVLQPIGVVSRKWHCIIQQHSAGVSGQPLEVLSFIWGRQAVGAAPPCSLTQAVDVSIVHLCVGGDICYLGHRKDSNRWF